MYGATFGDFSCQDSGFQLSGFVVSVVVSVVMVSVVRIRGCALASLGVCLGFHFFVLNIRSHRCVTSVVSTYFQCGVILVCHGTLCWSAVVHRHRFLLSRHQFHNTVYE